MNTKYKVTGPVAFMDYQPGEEFEAELDPDLEERALERGSISKLKNLKQKEGGDAETDRAN